MRESDTAGQIAASLRWRMPSIVFRGQGTVGWLPEILLQVVIVPRAKTTEGQLIEAVALPWFDIIELLEKDPSIAFQISDRKWEELIAGAYERARFDSVILTPRSGDFGRDVIAEKRGLGVVRVIGSGEGVQTTPPRYCERRQGFNGSPSDRWRIERFCYHYI